MGQEVIKVYKLISLKFTWKHLKRTFHSLSIHPSKKNNQITETFRKLEKLHERKFSQLSCTKKASQSYTLISEKSQGLLIANHLRP